MRPQRLDTGDYPAYAWPGGYPLYYVTADAGILCPDCVNENKDLVEGDDPQWKIVECEANYENHDLYCDHCNARIAAAYVD